MKHILKCQKCGAYTMKNECPICGGKTETPKPAKYSLEDKYASYRRQVKKPALSDKGLL